MSPEPKRVMISVRDLWKAFGNHQVLIGVLIYLRALVLGGLAVALVMAERRGATAASFARSSG